MASFVPASERIPGVKQQVKLQRSPGLSQAANRVLLIGWRLTGVSSAHDLQAVRVRNRSESQALAGSGSQLDLMAKAAIESAGLARFDQSRGFVPEIYCMPVPPLAGGGDVAATETITFAGTATSSGLITVRVGQKSITVPVAVGDTAATRAAAVEAELATVEPDLPFTAGVAAAVVTLTARERGAWGEDLVVSVEVTAAGITATVGAGTAGVGNVDLTTALAAAMAEDWSAIVIGEDSAAARTAVKAHVLEAWDFAEQKYRIAICPSGGDLSDATTAADAVDDYRIVVTNAEKVTAAADSSRAFAFEVAAAVGARLFSQQRSNYNFNLSSLAVDGRPRTIDRSVVNDAINAGVTVVLQPEGGTSPGQIVDPVSTATTDQTGQSPGVLDRTWQTIEIAKTVATVARSIKGELAGLAQLAATEETRLTGKALALAVLRQANRQGLVSGVEGAASAIEDDAVSAEFEVVGGATHLVIDCNYAVVTGLDIIAVTHNVTRAS